MNATRIKVKFAEQQKQIKVEFGVIHQMGADVPQYNGSYLVTPDAQNNIVLNTAQKFLSADVQVKKIPYAEVSNTANGTTVTIA